MSDKIAKSCCSCGSSCCQPEQAKKEVIIDFLYLDLSVCERCQGAESSLEEALREVAKVLEATGTEVKVNKININTKELAEEYKFLSSPTIRVNGRDIQMEFKESLSNLAGIYVETWLSAAYGFIRDRNTPCHLKLWLLKESSRLCMAQV